MAAVSNRFFTHQILFKYILIAYFPAAQPLGGIYWHRWYVFWHDCFQHWACEWCVCELLEKLMKRSLLYFACRHHVHEIVISEVFTLLLGPSHWPNIALFERFSKFWPNIDQSQYSSYYIKMT